MRQLEYEQKITIAEKASLEDERRTLQSELAQLQRGGHERFEADTYIRSLKDQNTKLKSIILKNSKDDTETLDDAVHGRYTELRDDIQRIVHRHYDTTFPPKLLKFRNSYFEKQKELREQLSELSTEAVRLFLIRAKIFRFINEEILSGLTFGIGNEFEESLREFERAVGKSEHGISKYLRHLHVWTGLMRCPGPSTLAEWRSTTIECAKALTGRSSLPSITSKMILNILQPLEKGSSRSQPRIEQTMLDLCDKAYDLSVLMRKNKKANFQVLTLRSGSEIIETQISPQAFDGPQPDGLERAKVAFTIFGGLTKHPEDCPGQIVLETAQVVCRTSASW